MGEFFIHVGAPVFVFSALCDHPFHGEEPASVVCKRDGHLIAIRDKKTIVFFSFWSQKRVNPIKTAKIFFILKTTNYLAVVVTDLVGLSTFLYARQPNNRLTVLQCCMEDGVGITFNLLFLPCWRFVIFFHLFPFYVFQCLREDIEETDFEKLIDSDLILLFADVYLCDDLSG